MAIPAIKLGARRILEGDSDEATKAGRALCIILSRHGAFTLGYYQDNWQDLDNYAERNPIYSPTLSLPEALYLLSNAKFNGILTLQPSEELLCYAESLNSSAPRHSPSFSTATSMKPGAISAKPRSTSKPGSRAKSSTARG